MQGAGDCWFSLLFWCKIMFLIWSFAHLEFKWWGRENVCVLWQFGLDLSSQPWFWFIPSGAQGCSGYYCGLTSGRSWFQIHRPAETFTDLYVCSLFYSSLLPPTVQRHVKLSGSELVIGVTRVLPLKQTSDPPPSLHSSWNRLLLSDKHLGKWMVGFITCFSLEGCTTETGWNVFLLQIRSLHHGPAC